MNMEVGTVYLKGPWAPKDKDFISGYISESSTSPYVLVGDRMDFRGQNVSFPRENVLRIEFNTGWR